MLSIVDTSVPERALSHIVSSSRVTLPYMKGGPVGVAPGSRADGW